MRSSYIYTVLKSFWPFEGNRAAEVAAGDNECDTPESYMYVFTLAFSFLEINSCKWSCVGCVLWVLCSVSVMAGPAEELRPLALNASSSERLLFQPLADAAPEEIKVPVGKAEMFLPDA